MEIKSKSEFQEKLVNLFLRLNGYFQTGYICHAKEWGNVQGEIDRIGIRFPHHSQEERQISCFGDLDIPINSIDIIIAEVKNDSLSFNNSLVTNNADSNWRKILNWIGLFEKKEIDTIIPKIISITSKNCAIEENTYPKHVLENQFGTVTIRPILFSIESSKSKDDTKKWINGAEILKFIWDCFCPEVIRVDCSTRYPIGLWGDEFSKIVSYLKDRHKNEIGIGTLDEMYKSLVN